MFIRILNRLVTRTGGLLCWVQTREFNDVVESKPPAGIVIRLLRPEDLTAADPELQLDKSFVQAALLRGDMCHGAFDKNQLVAYSWRSITTVPHNKDIAVKVTAGMSYGYKAFTLDDYRGRGLYPALVVAEKFACIERGIHHGISFYDTRNSSAMRANAKFKIRRVGLAGYFCVGTRVVTFHSPGVRAKGFQFVATDLLSVSTAI